MQFCKSLVFLFKRISSCFIGIFFVTYRIWVGATFNKIWRVLTSFSAVFWCAVIIDVYIIPYLEYRPKLMKYNFGGQARRAKTSSLDGADITFLCVSCLSDSFRDTLLCWKREGRKRKCYCYYFLNKISVFFLFISRIRRAQGKSSSCIYLW